MSERPNILLIISDQMIAALTGAYGHPVVKTAALERLCAEGIRFDAAYHGLFKCNLRRLIDYPKLSTYLKRLHAVPGVAETVNFDHIKRTYYTIRRVNPTQIIPKGPDRIFIDLN